jgi:hypothetical protein
MSTADVRLVHALQDAASARELRATRRTRAPAAPSVRQPCTHAEGRRTPRIYAPKCLATKQGHLCTSLAINSPPSQLLRVSSPLPPPQESTPLRSLPPPAKVSELLPRPHSSFHRSSLPCISLNLARTRAAAGTLPRPRRRCSPEPPPAMPPPPIDAW